MPAAAAHGPDPTLSGGPFGQNQVLRFRWRAGAEPTAAIKTAIRAAAADANASRASKAATFAYDAGGLEPDRLRRRARRAGSTGWPASPATPRTGSRSGCASRATSTTGARSSGARPTARHRTAATTPRRSRSTSSATSRVSTITSTTSSDSDYEDAVVQTFSRTKPSTGWNRHAFGRCDVATLQRTYDMLDVDVQVLDLPRPDHGPDPERVARRGSRSAARRRLTATLKVADLDPYGRLGGNPIGGRTVTLQRRAPGATTWTTVGTMPAGSTSGTYVLAQRPSVDTEFRAVYAASGEGLNGDTSSTIRVYVEHVQRFDARRRASRRGMPVTPIGGDQMHRSPSVATRGRVPRVGAPRAPPRRMFGGRTKRIGDLRLTGDRAAGRDGIGRSRTDGIADDGQ